jgi:undecaprenyl-diphosphatase
MTAGARLVLLVVLATVPIVVVGYFTHKYVAIEGRNVALIAWTTLGFGLLLGLTDWMCLTVRRVSHITVGGALFVGLAQTLAVLPGTSRAGVTITACRFLGMERREAARFSMLLSIPARLGAATLAGLELYRAGDVVLGLDAAFAASLSFVAALLAIVAMMRWLTRATFMPFVIYRIILGAGLLYWVYG